MTRSIDKAMLKALRPEINAALQNVARKYGITIAAAGGKYTNGLTGSFTLELKVDDPAAHRERDRETFAIYASSFGLDQAHFGAKFKSKGVEYELLGLELGRPKYAIRCRRTADDIPVFFTADIVPTIIAAAGKAVH